MASFGAKNHRDSRARRSIRKHFGRGVHRCGFRCIPRLLPSFCPRCVCRCFDQIVDAKTFVTGTEQGQGTWFGHGLTARLRQRLPLQTTAPGLPMLSSKKPTILSLYSSGCVSIVVTCERTPSRPRSLWATAEDSNQHSTDPSSLTLAWAASHIVLPW